MSDEREKPTPNGDGTYSYRGHRIIIEGGPHTPEQIARALEHICAFADGVGEWKPGADFVLYASAPDASFVLMKPLTAAAREWIGAHDPDPRAVRGGMVERRLMVDLVSSITADGLKIRKMGALREG